MRFKSAFIKMLVFILIFFMILMLNPVFQFAQNNNQDNSKNQEIKASPKNIRESTTFYVYIGWIWLVILVLIYILILKIKEADRIYRMRFESDKGKRFPH